MYNRVHIGNARPAVIFDTLFRVLSDLFPKVTYARNITDIDDKIIKEASNRNEDIKILSARYTQAYIQDMRSLNNLDPTISPMATEHISEMIDMISVLIDKGYAYVNDDHVLFSVAFNVVLLQVETKFSRYTVHNAIVSSSIQLQEIS